MAAIEQTGLVRYDAMQRAILAASQVDEVKTIRDQAQALEKYAQQARNFDAEKRAAQIRIHAELKAGELLRAREKAKGSGSNQHKRQDRSRRTTEAPKTLEEMGVSKDQSARWQRMAEDPKAVRDYLSSDDDLVPTTAGALAAVGVKPKPQTQPKRDFSDESLWLHGDLQDLVNHKIDPRRYVRGCNARMLANTQKFLDELIPYLTAIKENLP